MKGENGGKNGKGKVERERGRGEETSGRWGVCNFYAT